ncbi:MAG: MerR family transcriptional regulator [Deltaproteobacteria bacterium]|nr:MerR family transcriptional regulator [bacterium]MCB9487954.1 MerR family transcriptional regulator [Deltaproteobacteria bacterium]
MDNKELYPIRVVTRMTGLSPDIIRAWERRYGAVEPHRTDGNTRLFTSADIHRLALLKRVVDSGHNIKSIAGLTDDELEQLATREAAHSPVDNATAEQFIIGDDPYTTLRQDYMNAVFRFDVRRAARLLSRTAALVNPLELIEHVLLPVLRDTGHNWAEQRFSVAHEHLVSMQIRGLLQKITDYANPQPGSPKIIFTTPEGHWHEFGALVGALLAASRGVEPIYLGPHLPEDDIEIACEVSRANVLVLGIVRDIDEGEFEPLRTGLERFSQRIETWVGLPKGHRADGCAAGVRFLHDYDELDVALTRLVS